MKYITLTLLFVSSMVFCQVGINTTTPVGALDINSTNQGIVIPRVKLVNTTQELPVLNPTGDPLENGTLVYNTIVTNNVQPGFYYWETDRWHLINADPQFLKFTSITLPIVDDINDDVDLMFTTVNYNYNVFRIDHAGAIISGIANGVHGRVLYIYNGSATEDLKLLSEGGSASLAINRFSLAGDLILKSGNAVALFYDGVYLNRWVVARSDN